MRVSEVRKLMSRALECLQQPALRIDVDLNPDKPFGDGGTHMERGRVKCYAGMGGLPDSDIDIPDGRAMTGIVALFHEVCGHGMQFGCEFRKAGPLQKALCANYLACQSSKRYYGIDDNNVAHVPYFQQPHEIAAQYMGIKCAKSWIDSIVGAAEADNLILSYAEYRKAAGYSFLPDDAAYSSTDDILNLLDDKFQACLDACREFEPSSDDYDEFSVFSEYANFDVRAFVAHGEISDGDVSDVRADDEYCGRDNLHGYGSRKLCQASGLRQDVRMAAAAKWAWENTWTWMDKSVFDMRAAKALPLRVDQAFLKDGTPFILAPSKLTALDRLKAINAKSDYETVFGQDADGPEPGG